MANSCGLNAKTSYLARAEKRIGVAACGVCHGVDVTNLRAVMQGRFRTVNHYQSPQPKSRVSIVTETAALTSIKF
ncbi:cytochrome c553 [Mycobacterium sp. URHB0021]